MKSGDRRKKLWEIREAADSLRSAPIETPDFTQSILDRVDAERPFLAPSVRRKLPWIHASIGLTVALGVLFVAVVRREVPQVMIAEGTTPIQRVVECVECAAHERVDTLKQTLAAPASNVQPVELIELVATVAAVVENEGRARGAASATAFDPNTFDLATYSQLLAEDVATPVNSLGPVAPDQSLAASKPVSAGPLGLPIQMRPGQRHPLAGVVAGSSEPGRMRPVLLEHDMFSTIPPR